MIFAISPAYSPFPGQFFSILYQSLTLHFLTAFTKSFIVNAQVFFIWILPAVHAGNLFRRNQLLLNFQSRKKAGFCTTLPIPLLPCWCQPPSPSISARLPSKAFLKRPHRASGDLPLRLRYSFWQYSLRFWERLRTTEE